MSRRRTVVLQPQRAFDTRLETCDLYGLDDIPPGAPVLLRFRRCEDFASGTPYDVARRLGSSVVDLRFDTSAKRIESDWRHLYGAAREALLDDAFRSIADSH